MTYASLHSHCSFSVDGIGTVRQWVRSAKSKGLGGLALTDHGDCSSLMELYTIGKEEKFPVVLGCEIYAIDKLGDDKPNKKYYHLTVLVKNFQGYQNLCKLSTLSFQKDHFYYRPRVTFDELFAHKEGLIVTSGCLKGPAPDEILKGNNELAEKNFCLFKGNFGDDFYVELQPSIVIKEEDKGGLFDGINWQMMVNKEMLDWSKKYGVKCIITPDAHITDEKLKVCQDIKLHAKSNSGWDFDHSHHLFSPEELKQKVADHHPYMLPRLDEFMANTIKIVQDCQFDMPKFPSLLPDIDLSNHPLFEHREDKDTLDVSLLARILSQNGRIDWNSPAYTQRLRSEIDTLRNNGSINLLPYFFLLEDVIRWCKDNGVVVGPGRGSASGSLLCYGLGLTHLDPIKYGLSFERFINKARITKGTFPDVDLDFSDSSVVKSYVMNKYGHDHVAVVGTFQTLKTKQAIKDVLGLLRPQLSFMQKNELTSILPDSQQGLDELLFFHENLKNIPKLMEFMTENRDVYEAVIQLIGQPRQRGRHPCAMVVSPRPLVEVMPLWSDDETWVTQYSADWCKKVGAVKYDFLSLNTLNDIASCVKLIKQNSGVDIDPYNLPLDDAKTWQMFGKGDTATIFQFHTDIAIQILKKLNIKRIDDLALVTSLGRPGPMDVGMVEQYIDRCTGAKEVEYPHASLKDVLQDTYGIIVYQEQVMASVQILGGFTSEEADEVRRAMGLKDRELLLKFRDRFIDYATRTYSDVNPDRAAELWSLIESFARYGFNKSHAMAYGLIGYICQWLRCNHPLEWYCSVFSNGSKDDRKQLYPIIKNDLVLPEINQSRGDFYIRGDKIISSFNFVNGMGDKSVAEVVRQQPYQSFDDFLKRVNKRIANRNVILKLIFAGAFRNIEPNVQPGELIEKLFKHLKVKTGVPKEYQNLTVLDLVTLRLESLPVQDLRYDELFKDMVQGKIDEFSTVLERAPANRIVSVVGRFDQVTYKMTKKELEMAFIDIVNGGRKLRLVVWPEKLEELREHIKKASIVQVWGSVNIWNQSVSVVLDRLNVLKSDESPV